MPADEQTSIVFAHHFGWPQLAVGVVLLAVVLWQAHRWSIAPLSPGRRRLLVALRVAWSILLLWCIAQPTLRTVSKSETAVTPHVVVLVDSSASMAMSGGKPGGAWPGVQKSVGELKSRLIAAGVKDATWLSFGATLRTFDSLAKPDDAQSLVINNLRDAINQESRPGSPTVFFLITDGQDTEQTAPTSALAAAEGKDVRLLPIVPAGLTLSPPSLVRVERVDAPGDVTPNSAFDVKAAIRVRRGPADEKPLQLVLERDGQTIASTPLTARGDATIQSSFPTSAEKNGQFLYTVRVRDGAAELSHLSTVVRVNTRQSVRVLYVQGSLDWEYKFVRQAVADNPNIVLDAITRMSAEAYLRQTASAAPTKTGSDAIDQIKTTASGYDVIVLSNMNPDLLDTDLQQSLLDLVQKRGGGLLFFSGNAAQSARFTGTLLEQLLPVSLESASSAPVADDEASRQFSEFMHSHGNPIGSEETFSRELLRKRGKTLEGLQAMRLTPQGLASPIWNDPSSPGGSATLAQPPATFLFTAKAQRAKPAATVLAVHPSEITADGAPRPLFVTENIASGRSAFLGVDGLWRWRMASPSTARDYDRFWQQLFFWLGGRVQQSSIEFDRGRYQLGQEIHARLCLPVAPKADALPQMFARGPDGKEKPLPVSWNAAHTEATAALTPAGEGEVLVTARPSGAATGVPLAVQVTDVRSTNLEQEYCGLNEPLLRQLAEATKGQVLRPEDLDLVSSLVKTSTQTLEHTELTPLWHYPWLFIATLLLYSLELMLRRMYRLT